MATILLFHSIRGLCELERSAVERLRAEGHQVITPDLYAGETSPTIEAGFALQERIGWDTLLRRAEATQAPPDAVLAGASMGAAIASHLWANRPDTRGVLFLHGVAPIPRTARPGLPLGIHLAEPDPYEEEYWIGYCHGAANHAGINPEIFRYPGAGHLFTDPSLPDHDAAAAELLWQRVTAFLSAL